jgi:hypothetical protein
MIDQKSVIIGLIISVIIVLGLGFFAAIVQFGAVLIGAIVASYLANKKTQLKIVESALHGILVGIFTGLVQILLIFVRTGFSQKVAGILMITALVLIGAYIIVGALGGILGALLSLKLGSSDEYVEYEEPVEGKEEQIQNSEEKIEDKSDK